MRANYALCVLLACSALAACAGSDKSRLLTLELMPGPQNLGHIAQASLTEQGANTGISIFVGGVPASMGRPLQIYSYIYPGSCSNLAVQPAFSLNENVRAERTSNGWYLSKRLAVSLASLSAQPYALLLRSSPADNSLTLFCGDIE